MTTEQTAKQLRLAATILETEHPFQIKINKEFRTPSSSNPVHYTGTEIRLALATPPDGRVVIEAETVAVNDKAQATPTRPAAITQNHE